MKKRRYITPEAQRLNVQLVQSLMEGSWNNSTDAKPYMPGDAGADTDEEDADWGNLWE